MASRRQKPRVLLAYRNTLKKTVLMMLLLRALGIEQVNLFVYVCS